MDIDEYIIDAIDVSALIRLDSVGRKIGRKCPVKIIKLHFYTF
jgi:hypothetical protein